MIRYTVKNEEFIREKEYISVLEIKRSDVKIATKIMVVGVGGAGINIVNRMIDEKLDGVDFAVIDTDKQGLRLCKASKLLLIGEQLTKRMSAKADPEIGKKATKENIEKISSVLRGYEMVFIVSGMGGGTGTGAVPIVAKIAKYMGILTIVMVNKPFRFEAKVRMDNALKGIEKIKEHADSLIVISNDRLLDILDRRTTMPEALGKVDEVLLHTVRGITDVINVPANISPGFEDVKTVFKNSGIANIGFGSGKGEDKVMGAVEMAGWSIFMETTIVGAKHVLINVSGDVDLKDYYDAVSYIHELAGSGANIVGGLVYDASDSDTCNITVIATGLVEQ
jgi:cell division protein FtsZ